MPTYEYACRQCGEHFDVVQSFSDDALTECPKCHGELRKVFGSVGIVFKGSGFYKTDSRSSSSSVKATDPAKADSSASGDKSDKSDSSTKTDSTTKADTATKSDSSPKPSSSPAPAAASS